MIPDPTLCPHCGKPVSIHALLGLCPDCLLKAGSGTAQTENDRGFVPPTPGELARYFPQLEILELLGRGGMGAVYKARQRQLDRVVALKILPPGISHDPAFAERFAREARALARLHHPNIVTLYEFGETDGQYFFLMEFVDGVNLRQLLDAGRLAPKEALAIVPQICDALQFAHDQRIIHRDIKPENILLNKAGEVKVADFGVAKIVTLESVSSGVADQPARDAAHAAAGQIIGTPAYMAPEQFTNPEDVDNRADIDALGVVFYQMLTGELPTGKFTPPSSRSRTVQIDVRLDEVVLRALEKEPERRYQQVSEVKERVQTIASSGNARTRAKRTRSYLPWVALAAGLVVCAFALRALVINRHRNADLQVRNALTGVMANAIGIRLAQAGLHYQTITLNYAPDLTAGIVTFTGLNTAASKPLQGQFRLANQGGGIWRLQGGDQLLPLQFTVKLSGSDAASTTFDPPAERILIEAIGLNLAEGTVVDLPSPELWHEDDPAPHRRAWFAESPEARTWLRKNAIDLIEWNQGLLAADLHLVPLENKAWETLPSEALLEKLQIPNQNPAPVVSTLRGVPSTWGFESRTGARGILQIIETGLPHGGVKIRSKLVRQIPFRFLEDTSTDEDFSAIPPYPSIKLTLAWDGRNVTFADPLAFLPVVRQMPEYHAWLNRRDIHNFVQTNGAGYRLEAHYGGRVQTAGGGLEDLIMEAQIYRPNGTLLANTIVGTEHTAQRSTSIYDEDGKTETARLHWTRSVDRPDGWVDRVTLDPGTPKAVTWDVNRNGVVSDDHAGHSLPKYQDAPDPKKSGSGSRIQHNTPIPVTAAIVSKGDLPVPLYTLGTIDHGVTFGTEETHPLTAIFSIPDSEVQAVFKRFKTGPPVSAVAYDRDGKTVLARGTLIGVDNRIDPETGTLKCKASLTAEGGAVLLSGKFINLCLVIEIKHGVTLVPTTAITSSPVGTCVYIIRPDQTVTARHVTLGPNYSGRTELISGLSPGETIVLEPGKGLGEGADVSVSLAPVTAKPTTPGNTETPP